MMYHQITLEERYHVASLRAVGAGPVAIARVLGRHPSTIGRELRRNRDSDTGYRPKRAHARALVRRRVSRRNRRLSAADSRRVVGYLRQDWSPQQIAGRGRRTGALRISHETIYRYLRYDRCQGGALYQLLRRARKRRRGRVGRLRRAPGAGRSPRGRRVWQGADGSAIGRSTRWPGRGAATAS